MQEDRNPNRRRVLTGVAIAGVAVMLPGKWTRPIVESIIVPAHAAASKVSTTINPSTTSLGTTSGPGTTPV